MDKVLIIHDGRIDADNYLLEMTIGDYYELVGGIKNRLKISIFYEEKVVHLADI